MENSTWYNNQVRGQCCNLAVQSCYITIPWQHVLSCMNMAVDLSRRFQQRCSSLFVHQAMNSLFQHAWSTEQACRRFYVCQRALGSAHKRNDVWTDYLTSWRESNLKSNRNCYTNPNGNPTFQSPTYKIETLKQGERWRSKITSFGFCLRKKRRINSVRVSCACIWPFRAFWSF